MGKVVDLDKLKAWAEANAFDPAPAPPVTRLGLAWPTEYRVVTQWYGVNKVLYSPYGLPGHEGLDLRASNGSPIFACAPGVVRRAEASESSGGAYGIQVRLEHILGADTFASIYAHLQEIRVAIGDLVVAGQILGLADDTGNSNGAHLHLGLKKRGVGAASFMPFDFVNPVPYLPDLWPGNGWQVAVFGNLRAGPDVSQPVLRGVQPGEIARAVDFVVDWWRLVFASGETGWFWNPGYKMDAL